MFTGLVEGIGTVVSLLLHRRGGRLVVHAPFSLRHFPRGGSLSIQGCCLSVIGRKGDLVTADLSPETLKRTTLGKCAPGDPVNLERPVRTDQLLGGHIVQGHVDGIGKVRRIIRHDTCREFELLVPSPVAQYLVAKGSIAVNGVSLTINRVRGSRCVVMIIPETLEKTVFGSLAVGDPVNLEVDIIAKYVKKFVQGAREWNKSWSRSRPLKRG